MLAAPAAAAPEPQPPCDKPVYLTFDTGHMGVAKLVADLLHKYQLRATFFAANEKTLNGEGCAARLQREVGAADRDELRGVSRSNGRSHCEDEQRSRSPESADAHVAASRAAHPSGSLSPAWQAWWAARGKEGHEFASHTLNHTYWRADLPGDKPVRFVVRPSQGPFTGRTMTWTEAQYCEEIQAANDRLKAYTGKTPLALYRAPGGKTSPRLLAAAERCGYKHVGWSPAGFLGDELPSDKYPNDKLLAKALRDIRPGDILLAHLGIWSRKEPWAPAALEPLIVDLRAKGFCFATLREHPDLRPWLRSKGQ